jgi:hypothetical protein
MRNIPPSDGFSEPPERQIRHVDVKHYKQSTPANQALLDYLLDSGFHWDEAITLLHLRENLYENVEMRQRMADDYRMHFARWLYEHGLVGED